MAVIMLADVYVWISVASSAASAMISHQKQKLDAVLNIMVGFLVLGDAHNGENIGQPWLLLRLFGIVS
ncbi:hypothetical protein AKJ16_DCAP04011 [Drosera capensis]